MYKKYSDYLKKKFGERVHRISLDAGFTCPHKDSANTGCIYCNPTSFSFNSDIDLEFQISNKIKKVKKRFKANKFILYFQANTNTLAPVHILKQKYDLIYKYDDFVGLSISTRPDCVNNQILDLIESYSSDYEVWIEYGLQSIHDKTLSLINRGHDYKSFLKALELTKNRNIKICAHAIIGLPNEDENMILETAQALKTLGVDGVKIHPMHIVKETKLANIYNNFYFGYMDMDEYIKILAKFINILGEDILIHSLRAYCPIDLLISPHWVSDRNQTVIEKFEAYLKDGVLL